MWWLIPVIIGGLLLAAVTLSVIEDWVKENKKIDSSKVVYLREKIESNQYTVIVGIFNNKGEVTSANSWSGELDEDLKNKFGNKEKIILEL